MIYEKNIAAWKERYGEQEALKIDEMREEEREGSNVETVLAADGSKVLRFVAQERIWHLNSMVDPKRAAGIYAKRYREMKSFWVYFVFGLSDGRHIREMIANMDDTNRLFIYEPEEDIFLASMDQFDLVDIIQDERVSISTGNVEKIGVRAGAVINYCNRNLIEFCILPGYDILYRELCERYMDLVIRRIRITGVHKNTYEHFNRHFPRNMLFNAKNMLFHNDIYQLKKALAEKDLSGIPAIVVAAGPSLDKNIKELKKAEGRAFIIVVDAAIKRVLKEGIRPDLVVTEDALVPDRFFEVEGMEDVFWMAENTSRPEVLKRYGRKVFYFGRTFNWWDKKLIEELGYCYPNLPTGGSVAHTAYGMALYLGFRTVILIGQDLAFTGGRSHTSGLYDEKAENDAYIRSRVVVTVEDAEGNLLETDAQMKMYKEWYESDFQFREDALDLVIDATEGGAKIEGTVICSLRQAIEEECRGNLSLWEIERELEVSFSEEQQKRLLDALTGMTDVVERLRKEIEEMILEYEELRRMDKEGANVEAVRDKLESIAEQNKKIDSSELIELIAYYAKKEEYELQENIYKDEEIKIENLADRAIRLYRGYLAGIDLLEEDVAEIYG